MKQLSLKAKMTGIVSLTIAALLIIMSFLAFRHFEKEFRNTIAQHQFSMISAIAEQLDGKLIAARDQLVAVAQSLDPSFITKAGNAGNFMQSQAAALKTFDNGLYLYSRSGRIVAGTQVEPHMWGMDLSSREYVQETLRTGQPYISKPFASLQTHRHPIIMMTAPIVDSAGNIVAMLVGSLDLSKKNILGTLADYRIGHNGHLYLFSQEGTLLFHPNLDLIFSSIIPADADADPLLKRVCAGFEGSGEYIDSRGRHLLSSFKRLQSTGWILATEFPKVEAYAPIARTKFYFLGGMVGFLGLSMLTIHFCLAHLTKPLRKITEQARQVAKGATDLPPLRIQTGDEIGILAGTFNHMLARLEKQKATIHEQKEFAETLLRNSASPVFVIDAEHTVIAWNRACEELTGIPASEILGTDRHWQVFYKEQRPCLADIVIDEDYDNVATLFDKHSRTPFLQGGLQAEGWRSIRDKGQRYLIFRVAPIRNKQGQIIAAIETLEDYTDREEAETKMRHLAHFDHLTGLPNRALLFDRLGQGISEAGRYGQALALLFLDLNGFKHINDSLGHDVGDKALIEVAHRLQSCVRDCDTVSRMGGDEFTVILTRVEGATDASVIAQRILDALAKPLCYAGQSFMVGASIGISLFPEHGMDADTLVKHADTAMYDVKSEGKNQYRIFTEN